jgi:hypothetical protein
LTQKSFRGTTPNNFFSTHRESTEEVKLIYGLILGTYLLMAIVVLGFSGSPDMRPSVECYPLLYEQEAAPSCVKLGD